MASKLKNVSFLSQSPSTNFPNLRASQLILKDATSVNKIASDKISTTSNRINRSAEYCRKTTDSASLGAVKYFQNTNSPSMKARNRLSRRMTIFRRGEVVVSIVIL